MKLEMFRVCDFRSINDSTKIEVAHRTVLVGRNESGKSSLLKVLNGLKPPGAMVDFTFARDFPRDRPRKEFDDSAIVLRTRWGLSDGERNQLATIWPRGKTASHFTADRSYAAKRILAFEGVPTVDEVVPELGTLSVDVESIKTALAGEATAVANATKGLEQAVLSERVEGWAERARSQVATLKAALQASPEGSKACEEPLARLSRAVDHFAADHSAHAKAQAWVVERMPMFVYLDDWEEVPGHHDINGFLQRKAQGQQTVSDRLFEKLLKVAELDASELQKLLSENHEERKLLTNRAGRVLTKTLRELWKDRKITVEFNVDAAHFDVLVSDADTDALVPLDERSRGFRWYFSFFITFVADTKGGDKSNAILLLDEPGLFLHATAQSALLKFFDTLPNQIVYTTHSPFMIPPSSLADVRTVNLTEGVGTVVTSNPTGDANTLFPLQTALGYDLTQTLFVGARNVVIEGVTDYWYLSAVSEVLAERNEPTLAKDIVLTPAGGAPKIPVMVALLTAQNLRVAVLMDSEPQADRATDDMVKGKLIENVGVVRVADGFETPPAGGCDIEDLVGDDVFVALTKESYGADLKGKTFSLNSKIPRVVRRVEAAFEALGLKFQKSRPAKLFLAKVAKTPDEVLNSTNVRRFSRLLQAINQAVDAVDRRARTFER